MKPQRDDYRAELWNLMRFKASSAGGAALLAIRAPGGWLAVVLVAAGAVLLAWALMDCWMLGRLCRLDNEQRIRRHQRAVPARLVHRSRRRW